MLAANPHDVPVAGTAGTPEDRNVTPRRRKQLGSLSSFTQRIEIEDGRRPQTEDGGGDARGAWAMSPHPRIQQNKTAVTPTPGKHFLARDSSPGRFDIRKNLAQDFRGSGSSISLGSARGSYDDDTASEASAGSPWRRRMEEEPGTRECPLHSIASQLRSDFDSTVDEAAEAVQILAIQTGGEETRDIVTAGIIEPLVDRVKMRDEPEEELAALQNLGAAHDHDDTVKTHMVRVGVIPAVLRHVQPRDCNTSRLAAAVVLNLAIESEPRKNALVHQGACEMLSNCLTVPDDDLVKTALNGLTSLSIGSERRKAQIEATGISKQLLKLVHNHATAAEALSLIQSLVYLNDDRKRRILDKGLVQELTMVLVDPLAGQRTVEVGQKLLKGIAGFAEHEAGKTASRVATEGGGSLFGGFYAWAAEYVAPDLA
mmetsp:Transcript_9960/g.25549  ORF Transcript_9960/g.25549 Transcript_9960/m.25549 type:complete len:428 (+) Transcript_9960:285-1568(+)|eukprot:CAMPEP_0182919354 /NCGR_PEP_ID=MMETSP0105_2-20130417/2656_1 /TAXON_ID=81532 ORGANISM="Acanthoeca-like sp., Strain 10tr" /NCGR_SAMPLE_ID=MMETSP0105_2 /ASSEMBLY_ACC=CAM_ASM_000205 /LENGTH=427 /DNA_ID=CAMNT_0025056517 /DNA_START=64 /DNA_END=1347 /DNA_ORIENTATION=+